MKLRKRYLLRVISQNIQTNSALQSHGRTRGLRLERLLLRKVTRKLTRSSLMRSKQPISVMKSHRLLFQEGLEAQYQIGAGDPGREKQALCSLCRSVLNRCS